MQCSCPGIALDRSAAQTGRIHAAGQTENYVVAANLRADFLDQPVFKIVQIVIARRAADAVKEIANDRGAVRRAFHFGMELRRIEPARRIRHCGIRAGLSRRSVDEALGQLSDLIAMTHQTDLCAVKTLEQHVFGIDRHRGLTVFALRCRA